MRQGTEMTCDDNCSKFASIKTYAQKTLDTIPWIFFILLATYIVVIGYITPLEYDSLVHEKLITNIIEKNLYSDGTIPFDSRLSTGPALILPSAWCGKLFVNDAFVLKIPVLLYSFFSVVLTFIIASICLGKRPILNTLITISSAWFLTSSWSVHILGESCAVFWILLATLCVIKNKPAWFLCGFCWGIALSTKYITVLLLSSFTGCLILAAILFRKKGIMPWKSLIKFIIGCPIPLFLFEIYKFIYLGWTGYLAHWQAFAGRLFVHHMPQNDPKPSIIAFFQKHYDSIGAAGYLKQHGISPVISPILFILCVVVLVWVIRQMMKSIKTPNTIDNQNARQLLIIISMFVASFSWIVYQYQSPTFYWYRRLIPFYYVFAIASILAVFALKMRIRFVYLLFVFTLGYSVHEAAHFRPIKTRYELKQFIDTVGIYLETQSNKAPLGTVYCDAPSRTLIIAMTSLRSSRNLMNKDFKEYTSAATLHNMMLLDNVAEAKILYCNDNQDIIKKLFEVHEITTLNSEYHYATVSPKQAGLPKESDVIAILSGENFPALPQEMKSAIMNHALVITTTVTLTQPISKIIADISRENRHLSTSTHISIAIKDVTRSERIELSEYQLKGMNINLQPGTYEIAIENYYSDKNRPFIYINALYFCK